VRAEEERVEDRESGEKEWYSILTESYIMDITRLIS
jgi:hypothetical protein